MYHIKKVLPHPRQILHVTSVNFFSFQLKIELWLKNECYLDLRKKGHVCNNYLFLMICGSHGVVKTTRRPLRLIKEERRLVELVKNKTKTPSVFQPENFNASSSHSWHGHGIYLITISLIKNTGFLQLFYPSPRVCRPI